MKNVPLLLLFFLALGGGPRVARAEGGEGSVLYKLRQLSQLFGPEWIEGKISSSADESAAVTSAGGLDENGLPVPPPNAEFLPYWLPMCFLFDPKVDAGIANEKLKRMTSAYASCGIVLEPHVITVKPDLSGSARSLQEAAMAACPFPSAFGVRGAVQLELNSAAPAQEMCSDPGARGCSSLCSPISVSFVAPNSGPAVGLHESMHSNCCGPVCVDSGEGAGVRASADMELAALGGKANGGPYHAFKGSGPRFSSITKEGCRALQSGASQNKFTQDSALHWYDPDKKVYVVLEQNPRQQFDLMAKKSFFPKRVASSAPVRESITGPIVGESIAIPVPEAREEPIAPAVPISVRELASMGAPNRKAGRARSRGAALRKAGDPTRKFGGGEIGTIDAYGEPTEGASEASPPGAPFPALDTTP